MMRVNSNYDAVVLGEGHALLAAGLTMVRNGARTLLVPLSGGSINAVPFNTGPYLDGLDLHSLIRELGLSPAEMRHLTPLTPSFQFITPKCRFELTADDEPWQRAARREFPEITEAAARQWCATTGLCHEKAAKTVQHLSAFTSLPPQGFKQRWRNRQVSARLGSLHKHRSFRPDHETWEPLLRGLALMLTSAVPSTPLHQGTAEYLIGLARWGSVDGRSFSSLLKQQLQKRDAEFLTKGQALALEGKRRTLLALRLQDGETAEVQFRTLILAAHPFRLQPLLHDAHLNQLYGRWVERHNVAYDRYVLPLTLLKEGMPVGMAPRALLIRDPQQPLLNENLLLVDREESGDGKVQLWCRFIVPHGEPPPPQLHTRILDHLNQVIPFLNENLLPPQQPLQLQGCVYGDGARGCSLFGVGPRTPFKNMLLGSAANLPELAVDGELLAATKTAQMALLSRVKRELGGLVLERNLINS